MPKIDKIFHASVSQERLCHVADDLGIDWQAFRHALQEIRIDVEIDTDEERPVARIKRVQYGGQTLAPEVEP